MVISMYLTMSENLLSLTKKPLNNTSVCYEFDADQVEGPHQFEMMCDFSVNANSETARTCEMWERAALEEAAQRILAWASSCLK